MLNYFGRLWGLVPEEETVEEGYFVSRLSGNDEFVSEEAYYTPTKSSRSVDEIEIEGEERFCSYTRNCLYEIARHGKFESMVANIKKIRQVQDYLNVGMGADGVFSANELVFDDYGNDYVWGASQIIHDAKHYERMLAGMFDRSNYIGEELIAFVPQAEFLRDCGRYSQARYIESQDGRHVLDRVDA